MQKNTKIMVSIIVPVYNSERYLDKCIESLIEQTYSDIEIILVDDGSEDRSGNICDQYAQKAENIYVIHKKNGGVSSARNRGIEYAKGDYLVFVDSDDVIHRELVEIYVRVLVFGGTPVCSVAKDKQELSVSYVNNCEKLITNEDRDHFMRFLYADYVNPPWNKMYDAKLIHAHNIRFREDKNLGEDFFFNLQYLLYAQPEYTIIHFPLYYYREGRENSLDNSYHSQMFELQIEMFDALYEFMQQTGSWNEENQSAYYQLYWNRLYLTICIYKKYADKRNDSGIYKKILKYLGNPIWNKLEVKYREKCLYNYRHLIKYLYLKILKQRLEFKRV